MLHIWIHIHFHIPNLPKLIQIKVIYAQVLKQISALLCKQFKYSFPTHYCKVDNMCGKVIPWLSTYILIG